MPILKHAVRKDSTLKDHSLRVSCAQASRIQTYLVTKTQEILPYNQPSLMLQEILKFVTTTASNRRSYLGQTKHLQQSVHDLERVWIANGPVRSLQDQLKELHRGNDWTLVIRALTHCSVVKRLIMKINLMRWRSSVRRNKPKFIHLQKEQRNNEKTKTCMEDLPRCVVPKKTARSQHKAQTGRTRNSST